MFVNDKTERKYPINGDHTFLNDVNVKLHENLLAVLINVLLSVQMLTV